MSNISDKSNTNLVLNKIRKYCAYQERCHKEVKDKLATLGVYGNEAGNLMIQLVEEGFLNEERFAMAVAQGRFRQKGWGRRKIESYLKSKGIEGYLLEHCLDGLENKDYIAMLEKLIHKKVGSIKAKNDFEKKQKLAAYIISKGFESSLTWETIHKMIP